jgi:hypothetical protein
MQPSTADALDLFRSFTAEQRRELIVGIIRDFVARDGRHEAIRVMLANVFEPETSILDRQAETLAAFARLPKDVAAALLAPFDQASVRVEDCLPDDEVAAIVAGSAR